MQKIANQKNNISKQFQISELLSCVDLSKCGKYLPLLNESNIKEIICDADMHSTADAFFANNLNISQTSKNAFMHRNTLVYRLDKIRKLTGLNLKNFDDAVAFKNLLAVYSMVYKDEIKCDIK